MMGTRRQSHHCTKCIGYTENSHCIHHSINFPRNQYALHIQMCLEKKKKKKKKQKKLTKEKTAKPTKEKSSIATKTCML